MLAMPLPSIPRCRALTSSIGAWDLATPNDICSASSAFGQGHLGLHMPLRSTTLHVLQLHCTAQLAPAAGPPP